MNSGEEFTYDEQLRLVHEHLEIVRQEKEKMPPSALAEGEEDEEEKGNSDER